MNQDSLLHTVWCPAAAAHACWGRSGQPKLHTRR